jgi:hypothetical protein
MGLPAEMLIPCYTIRTAIFFLSYYRRYYYCARFYYSRESFPTFYRKFLEYFYRPFCASDAILGGLRVANKLRFLVSKDASLLTRIFDYSLSLSFCFYLDSVFFLLSLASYSIIFASVS